MVISNNDVAIGETVYFSGAEQVFANGDRLSFGLEGVVTGQGKYEGFAAVHFKGHEDYTNVHTREICRHSPLIPGGFTVGDRVFWTKDTEVLCSGDRLLFGLAGEVKGRSSQGCPKDDDSVAVHFNGNSKITDVLLTSISRTLPAIMGGFTVGDTTYFLGARQELPNGDQLKFGLCGKVTGPVPKTGTGAEQRVAVRFDGNRVAVPTCVRQLSRSLPDLQGFALNDRVSWAGKAQTLSSGDELFDGLVGDVVGRPALRFDGKDDERILVRFDGHRQNTPVNRKSIRLVKSVG